MILTLADANRVIAGAIEKANQIGAKMNIAVCDAGGRLLAFQRMDGAMWAGSFGSQGKAMASAAFGRPSGDLTPRADHPTLRGIAAAEGNHMFYGQGAVPIFRQGVLIGACGVGGGSAQEDYRRRRLLSCAAHRNVRFEERAHTVDRTCLEFRRLAPREDGDLGVGRQ